MGRLRRSRGKWGGCLVVGCIAAFCVSMAGCGKQTAISEDILSQRPEEHGRTRITVLVKYAFAINSLERAVEEKFPDIDIVQVGNYTHDMGIDEFESRLAHDDLPDIVMNWPLNVGEQYWEDRLIDLSGLDVTNRYNISMLNNIAKDGKLYYLPGPSQVRGIVYNKTLFEENGWEVPEDYEGFLQLCREIEASGIKALQLGFANGEVLDTAFVGFNYENFYSKPQDVQWIADYNSGKGSFGDHFRPALEHFRSMAEAGIWKPEDLTVGYAQRENMLFTRKCAMVEDSVLMAKMGYGLTGSTDEFALMPFFNQGEDGDWARLYMVCYIGLNKHLTDADQAEKYKLVLELLDYISTPEGQEALAGDTGAMFSSLVGAEPPDIPEIEALLPALKHGRYAIFPELKNAQPALREGLAGLLNGDLTVEDVIRMVDSQNQSPPVAAAPVKLGQASADFTLIETGNFVTDIMRAQSGCEVALFLDNGKDGRYNGKGISARLYEGDVTQKDIRRVWPDLKHGESGTLWKVTMTGEDLIDTLEYTITVDNNATGWFYYFSGLKMEFNPVAEPGNRISKITMADGKAIDPEKVYSIAVMDDSVPEEKLLSCEKTEVKILDILDQAVKDAGTISPSGDGRFVIVD